MSAERKVKINKEKSCVYTKGDFVRCDSRFNRSEENTRNFRQFLSSGSVTVQVVAIHLIHAIRVWTDIALREKRVKHYA